MQVKAELFGTRFGNNNITEMLTTKECGILLKIQGDNDKFKHEYILNLEEASKLVYSIQKCLNNKIAKDFGFKVV